MTRVYTDAGIIPEMNDLFLQSNLISVITVYLYEQSRSKAIRGPSRKST